MRIPRPGPALAATVFALFAALPAQAVSNRIFMSTNGNNASDCANPLTPCLTFAGALAQVNPGGEVIAEATGGYGALNITQAVTISGPPGVVIYSGLGVTVNAPGAIVVLRGLTIDGSGASGNGVMVTAIGKLFVESCVIANFSEGGIGTNGVGIYLNAPGELAVRDTVVRNNGFVGIWINPPTGTATASIERCRLDNNEFGLDVLGAGVSATVKDSSAGGSSSYGLGAETSGELNIENCAISSCSVGIKSTNGTVRVSNSTVTDNSTGVSAGGVGVLLSRGNNTVQGNVTKGAFTGTFSAD